MHTPSEPCTLKVSNFRHVAVWQWYDFVDYIIWYSWTLTKPRAPELESIWRARSNTCSLLLFHYRVTSLSLSMYIYIYIYVNTHILGQGLGWYGNCSTTWYCVMLYYIAVPISLSFTIWSNRKTLLNPEALNNRKPWARKHQVAKDTSHLLTAPHPIHHPLKPHM